MLKNAWVQIPLLTKAILSEWSKEPVSSTGSESCAGSNPADSKIASLAQLVEHALRKCKVRCSIHLVG